MQETQVHSLGWEVPVEKEMAVHSSVLPGEFHGQRSLVSYVRGVERLSDTHFHDLMTNMN